MNDVIKQMLERYDYRRLEDANQALREILQEIALLGLWRAKFFEKAAFYGGTALRILYNLDRYSEDLDFSLMQPDLEFDLSQYLNALEREIRSFGFDVTVTKKEKTKTSQIQSAFMKADTQKHLILIESSEKIGRQIPAGQALKIKIEVDTNPPLGFKTEPKFLLRPIPFSVKVFTLPDLFAGKMHEVLCRRWKNRVKGRDWYDLVWYAANHPQLHLAHLEKRMLQSGHLKQSEKLTSKRFFSMTSKAIDSLNVEQARQEVEPFVKNADSLQIWSKVFFRDVVSRIRPQ
ncbi:MAG: nucleotidyl transferase AbiEii/AbiGii toxin family protein [Elusimicrobiota bacterium]